MAYSKFHNRKCEYRGEKFDSLKERDRYIYLKSLEAKGEVCCLRRQVEYRLIPAAHYMKSVQLKTKVKAVRRLLFDGMTYRADFVYIWHDHHIVEDVKGSSARGAVDKVFLIKQKLMWYFYWIKIHIVTSPTEEPYYEKIESCV